MTRLICAALAICLTLSACGSIRDSRINPFNWFGGDREEARMTDAQLDADPRPLVDQILSLNVDPTPEGAIVRVIGVPGTQGYWEADLIPIASENPAEKVYEFRASAPLEPTRQGTQRSREIIAGAAIPSAELKTIRTIVVIGRTNQRSVRR
ncbi:MAG: hypothetical protein HKP40_02605 [Litoreibacter sp.]|nr:hypothetical protein [Litoreibacter sp.]